MRRGMVGRAGPRQQEGQEKLGGEGAAVLGGVVRGGLPEEAVFTQNVAGS